MSYQKHQAANIFASIGIYGLFLLGILLFGFALVSGSEAYGGGLKGILKNSPNALPWLALFVLLLIARKWKVIGGLLLCIFGIGLVYFFNFNGPNFFLSTFLLSLLIPLLASFLLISAYLERV